VGILPTVALSFETCLRKLAYFFNSFGKNRKTNYLIGMFIISLLTISKLDVVDVYTKLRWVYLIDFKNYYTLEPKLNSSIYLILQCWCVGET
jgi:hypothetical protein